ncbi:MAG: aminoglycoside phosphotransferase family protein [Candidatus Binatia bacterium]
MIDPLQQLISEKISLIFGAGTALTSLAALAGDASSRRYYRAQLSGAVAPATVIIMDLPAGSALPLSSEELTVFKEDPKELPFLNLHRFLSRIGVNVPKLYGQWENQGIIILEDLGDIALWDRVQNLPDEEIIAWYQKAIDELLRLQIVGTAQRDDACIAFQQRFDFKLYMWEFEHFIEWGLEKRPGAKIHRTAINELRKWFSAISETLQNQLPCLNHRDYHSWNLMVRNESLRVIDFQDALLAPPQYDLASLLNDRITDELITPPIEQRLVHYYIDASRALGRTVDPDAFIEIYRLSAIQRDLKVVGRFYYLDLVKGKPAYRKFIAPTVRRLVRNFANTPQARPILPLLLEQFEAMQ